MVGSEWAKSNLGVYCINLLSTRVLIAYKGKEVKFSNLKKSPGFVNEDSRRLHTDDSKRPTYSEKSSLKCIRADRLNT